MKVQKEIRTWLFRQTRRQLPCVGVVTLLSMLSSVAYLWLAMLSKELIEVAQHLFSPGDLLPSWDYLREPALYRPVLTVIAVVCGQVVVHVVQSRLRVHAAGKLEMQLRHRVFSSLLHADYTTVNTYHSGELLTRLTSDVQLVSQTMLTLLPNAAAWLSKLVGGIVLLAVLAPDLAVVVVSVGVVAIIGSRLYGAQLKRLHKRCQAAYGKTRSFMQDVFSQLMSVKAFSVESSATQGMEDTQQEHFRWKLRRNRVQLIGGNGMYLLLSAAYYILLVWCVFRLAAGAMTVGTLTALLQIFEQLQAPIRNASGLLPQYYAMMASAERLQQVDTLPSEPTAEPKPLKAFHQLSICGVTFAYDDKEPVLREVSLTVRRGECVALVGSSGIGKSTLLKLILAIYPCQTGSIEVEGETRVPVDAGTRCLMAYVPQGNALIAGTIRDNIAFFRSATEERLHTVAKMACLDEWIASLPMGLDTPVGENGVGVSEGQAQRIAIARALLDDAPILLLDECTSALDAVTEERLLSNIRQLSDKAVLLISHKDTTIAGSTAVWRLIDGQLRAVKA